METLLPKLFSEFGVISTLFIVLILSIIWGITKYVPKVIVMHFEALKEMQREDNGAREKMQQEYMDSLREITERHALNSKEFLQSIRNLGDEHVKQLELLESIKKTADEVHYQLRDRK